MHSHIVNQMRNERTRLEYDPSLIMRMREVGAEQIDDAAEKYYKAKDPISLVAELQNGLFDTFVVASGNRIYEIARLGFFWICTCADFKHSHSACKHLHIVLPKVCRVCFAEEVAYRGTTCEGCKRKSANEAIDNSAYLKPTSDYRPTAVGSVRI